MCWLNQAPGELYLVHVCLCTEGNKLLPVLSHSSCLFSEAARSTKWWGGGGWDFTQANTISVCNAHRGQASASGKSVFSCLVIASSIRTDSAPSAWNIPAAGWCSSGSSCPVAEGPHWLYTASWLSGGSTEWCGSEGMECPWTFQLLWGTPDSVQQIGRAWGRKGRAAWGWRTVKIKIELDTVWLRVALVWSFSAGARRDRESQNTLWGSSMCNHRSWHLKSADSVQESQHPNINQVV